MVGLFFVLTYLTNKVANFKPYFALLKYILNTLNYLNQIIT